HRWGHRGRPRPDHPALPQPDADPLRDGQGSRGPPGRGDRGRARNRPRDVNPPTPRPGLILDGKVVAQKVLDEVRAGVARFRDATRVAPTLAVVLVGDFAPSKIYVANKKKAADSVGIAAEDHLHPEGLDRTEPLPPPAPAQHDPPIHRS